MPILEPILRFFRKKPKVYIPPPAPKRPWSEIVPIENSSNIPPEPLEMPPMPEGVDFGALWEEPTDASSLGTILAGVSAVCAGLILILKLFGK